MDSGVFLGPKEEPAAVTVDVTFTSDGKVQHFRPGSSDPTDPTNFAGEFRFGTATGSFFGENASGFMFRAPEVSSAGVFAEMGKERNGAFLQSHVEEKAASVEAGHEANAVAPQAIEGAMGGAGLSLTRTLPNPAAEASSIEFALGVRGPVSLAVFDPAGRRVATMLDGQELAPGRHAYRWDLRDESGRRVAPGIYLVQWKTATEVKTSRVVVLP